MISSYQPIRPLPACIEKTQRANLICIHQTRIALDIRTIIAARRLDTFGSDMRQLEQMTQISRYHKQFNIWGEGLGYRSPVGTNRAKKGRRTGVRLRPSFAHHIGEV